MNPWGVVGFILLIVLVLAAIYLGDQHAAGREAEREAERRRMRADRRGTP